MKNTKRILALLTAILLSLSLSACLVPNDDKSADTETPVASDNAGKAEDAASPAADFDGEAVAIELGDIQITANEVANVFDSYISMFSYSSSIDREVIDQCLTMAEDEAIRYYVPLWKAQELGVTLDEETELELSAKAHEEIEEERNALLCQFAYYYGATEEIADSASELTEEQIQVATDAIDEQLAAMFREGFVFEDYLALEHDSILEGYRIEKLTALLQDRVAQDPPTAEEVDTWYTATLEAQKAEYDETPLNYYYDANASDGTPVLYTPDGFVRVQVIELLPDGEPDEKIDENERKLKELEAEYGTLALNDKDPERQAEIVAEYAALKAENAALDDAFYGDVRAKINEAYAALQAGTSFEDVMNAYNRPAEDGSTVDERLVYTKDADPYNGELGDFVKGLEPGAYSEPTLIDGAYVIVKVTEVLKEGPVDRAAIEEDVRIAAKTALAEEAWEAQFDAWLTEAKEIAVFHRDTYEMIGDMYLS